MIEESQNPYTFTDNPTVSGVSPCNTDILNDNIMYLKHELEHIAAGLETGDIGFALTVDETKGTRRILNGSIVIINSQTQGFLNWLKALQATNPEYFKTEEEWQATKTLSPEGIVNAFVLDETAGTIRLMNYPKYFVASLSIGGTAPVRGTGNIGLTVNGAKTTLFAQNNTFPGFYDAGYGGQLSNYTGVAQGHGGTIGITPDGSKSGIVADLSGLGTEKIKGVYFIQINSGTAETDKPINNYTVNNPYSYGMFQYLPEGTYNPSWLISSDTYYTKAVYTDLYNWILTNYNAEKEGFKASTATDITDYDFAINITDETFRLPLKTELESNQTPQGWALYFYCGDTLQNLDLMNVARIEESLATKTNATQAAHAAMPSGKSISLTAGASGAQYTAPADGYFVIGGNSKSSGTSYIGMNSSGLATTVRADNISAAGINVFLPVTNGKVITLNYVNMNLYGFTFVYANGTESEAN